MVGHNIWPECPSACLVRRNKEEEGEACGERVQARVRVQTLDLNGQHTMDDDKRNRREAQASSWWETVVERRGISQYQR